VAYRADLRLCDLNGLAYFSAAHDPLRLVQPDFCLNRRISYVGPLFNNRFNTRESSDMRLVNEVHMVGNTVNAHPIYRTVISDLFPKIFDLFQSVTHNFVAGQA
jgi:hypothetical protein